MEAYNRYERILERFLSCNELAVTDNDTDYTYIYRKLLSIYNCYVHQLRDRVKVAMSYIFLKPIETNGFNEKSDIRLYKIIT